MGAWAPPAKAPARPKSAPKLAHGGGGHAGAANRARGFVAESPSCFEEPAGAADSSDVPAAAMLNPWKRPRVSELPVAAPGLSGQQAPLLPSRRDAGALSEGAGRGAPGTAGVGRQRVLGNE